MTAVEHHGGGAHRGARHHDPGRDQPAAAAAPGTVAGPVRLSRQAEVPARPSGGRGLGALPPGGSAPPGALRLPSGVVAGRPARVRFPGLAREGRGRPRLPGLTRLPGRLRVGHGEIVTLVRDRVLRGAVVAIGNAPTALFRLLELLDRGAPRPAAVIGIPVGFIGAAESKRALADSGLAYLVVHGRRGGSAMTVAAVNAIASEAE